MNNSTENNKISLKIKYNQRRQYRLKSIYKLEIQ